MKHREILLNTQLNGKNGTNGKNGINVDRAFHDAIGEQHAFTSIETPMREDAVRENYAHTWPRYGR